MEDEDAVDFGDFGDSLLRRLCLDAVAVGEHAPFGEVRSLVLLRSGSEQKKAIDAGGSEGFRAWGVFVPYCFVLPP